MLDQLADRLGQSPYFRLLRRWYYRNERIGLIAFFVGGVTWDATTLRRIDAWFDNLFLLGYLLILGALTVLAILDQNGRLRHPKLQRLRPWFPPIIQFVAGALFSAYVVYYAQSVSWASSIFLIVLVGLLVANEFIWARAFNLYVLIGAYFLATLTFFIFFLPVLFGAMGYGMFFLSSLISMGVVGGMLYYVRREAALEDTQLAAAGGIVVLLLLTMHLFYAQNWIPPVPLALRSGGVYHDVQVEDNTFTLTYEPAPWYQPWRRADDVFHSAPGDTVYCFAAVFAPTALETQIVHHWQRFNPGQDEWMTTDRIRYDVTGGRRNGYRGVTFKQHAPPGQWRVDVETPAGQVLGRIGFRIAPPDSTRTPRLRTLQYD
jgi:hypothetical protein